VNPRGELPEGEPGEAPWWPADGPWGGRGRKSVLLVVGGVVVVVAVVLAVTLLGSLSGSDPGSGSAAVGGPPEALPTGDGPTPAARVLVDGAPYDVGVGAFTPSARAAPAGSHLLLASVVVRNAGPAPVTNPLSGAAGLLVAVGLHQVPASVLTGPSALLCRNAPPTSPLASAAPVFPGLDPGACVLDGRTTPTGAAAPTLAAGDEARGLLLSSPVPDVVTDPAPSVWVQTTAGPPARYDRVGAGGS
jgi:hypothetical protein